MAAPTITIEPEDLLGLTALGGGQPPRAFSNQW